MKKISDRVTSDKAKHLLVENELKILKTFDLNNFESHDHFEEDGTQNYLVFQPMQKYFKRIEGVGSGGYIYFWKSEGLSDERINSDTARVGSCLKQDKATYNHGAIVNIYIVYEISRNYNIGSYPTLESCLFGAVSLTKHADIDQYKYYIYGIGFDRKGKFSFGNRSGRNSIVFGADM